jgi:hypothetical protein
VPLARRRAADRPLGDPCRTAASAVRLPASASGTPVDARHRRVAAALIAAGAILRVWQYLANGSLWIDEAALARNLIDRPAGDLFGRLDYAQIAPIGFRLIERGAVAFFGTSEYALRLFPLVCSLASLPLFWIAAGRVLGGWAAAYAVGLLALGLPFIYLAQQVKQYSSDVLAAVVILLMMGAIQSRAVTIARAAVFGIAGALVAWCSQPSALVLAGAGAALLAGARPADAGAARARLLLLTLWGAGAASAGLHARSLLSPIDLEYFRWFWANGFMPFPPANLAEAAWIFSKLTWAFGAFATDLSRAHGGLNYRWSWVFTVVCLIGMWALLRRRREAGIAVVLPVALTAALSALDVYPFTARLFAFLLPGLLLSTAAGAEVVLAAWPDRARALSPVAMAVLGGAPLLATATALPPYRPQHTRPLIEHIAARMQPGDAVYVYYGAGQAFRYYERRGVIALSRDDLVMGRCEAGSPRDYLRAVDRLRGRSGVWMLVSTAEPTGPAALIHGYLSRIGRLRASLVVPATPGYPIEAAALYLFDLSDPARLAAASAEMFPVGAGMQGAADRRFRCRGVAAPDREPQ